MLDTKKELKMFSKVIKYNVFERWPLEDRSVQAIITSPPYFRLRKYDIPDVIIGGNPECVHEFKMKQTFKTNFIQGGASQRPYNFEMQKNSTANTGFCVKCSAWCGQYGLETSFQLYIEHTKIWMQEAIRVLKDDGLIFVNIADSYNGSFKGVGQKTKITGIQKNNKGSFIDIPTKENGYPRKSRLLIPERFAIMCVDELGLILRNHIVWKKENSLPESVKDRFSKKWESIFMFAKSERYYFNLDAVREPLKECSIRRMLGAVSESNKYRNNSEIGQNINKPRPNRKKEFAHITDINEIKKALGLKDRNPSDVWEIPNQSLRYNHYAAYPSKLVERMILCSTKAGDIVLDPFAGSGTTILVAEQLNRTGIGFDIGYDEIQKERLKYIQKRLL